jgi:CubicO group peptidase (beta-lactamase class C family)
MARFVTALVVAALASSAHAAPLTLSPPSPEAEKIRAVIGNTKGLDAPGCAISVLQDSKIKLFVVDGAADIAAKKPLDADTQMYTASVAKQFTVLAIAQLVVAGKIGLNDDIRKYLPEMPEYRVPVTVAMLIHHTSGVRDLLELGTYAGYETATAVSRAVSLKLVMSQPDTAFVPGTQYRYSNGGYLLLSEIVERVSGTPFADYMKTKIFAPMGMKRTFVLNGARTADANAAHGYVPEGDGFKLADTHPLYGGAGGAVFTINDLVKYDYDFNFGHKVWTPAIRQIMLEPGKLTDGRPANQPDAIYAGGVMLNGPWVQHGGSGEGFKNAVAWLPDRKAAIHILCNNGTATPAKMANRIVDILGVLPSMREADVSLAGRYTSPDLPVFYTLAPNGADKLTVTISPKPGGPGGHRVVELSKTPDGSFTGRTFKIVPDNDQRGFALGDDRRRAGVLRFRRVD